MTRKKFYASLALIALIEIVTPHIFDVETGHFSFENFPAFGSICGVVSCVLIIVVSKFLGHQWLTRKEDYYEGKNHD